MNNTNLNIYYQNCGGLRSKLTELKCNIQSSNYDIIVLTETWLVGGIYDSELVDDRYSIFRRDRNLQATHKKDGGGILVAINKKFSAARYFEFEDNNTEQIYITLPISNSKTIILSATYIPPKTHQNTYILHFNTLKSLYTKFPSHHFIIVGDYNIPDLRWSLHSTENHILPVAVSNLHKELESTIMYMQLKQYNIIYNANGRLLDLMLTNYHHCICSPPPTELSKPNYNHHPPLLFSFKKLQPAERIRDKHSEKYNFHKCDFSAIKTDLSSINWVEELRDKNVSESVSYLYIKLYNTINKHVPVCKPKSIKYPQWFSKALTSTLSRKKTVWKKWKIYHNLSDYREFSLLRDRAKLLLKQDHNSYISKIESGIADNVKHFWKYVSSLKKNESGYPSKMLLNENISESPSEIANMFNEFFSSIFETRDSDLDTINLNTFIADPEAPHIPSIEITKYQVEKCLINLDIGKGPGPDKIGPIFLKNTAKQLSEPLWIIFNRSIEEGTFPETWKLAFITPLHKSGPRNNVSYYRPISGLSTMPKIFETLVKDCLYAQLSHNIIENQHGFTQGKSTITNLILYSNFLFNAMDQGLQVDTIYTDFQKAFDKVDHILLLKKLAQNGITGNLLHWFKSYLNNRYQTVIINGYHSDQRLVSSGVIQGSILGPLQYILFVNDIAKCFHNCRILMFADDLKIFKTINNIDDCQEIQDDLDRFHQYCTINKLHLAPNKCQQISFTRKRNKLEHAYNIGGQNLERVASIRDLGVQLDDKLIFDQHITNICKKAYQMLGFILRISKSFRQANTLLVLYKTLVRSQLEYASVIWNPLYKIYSEKIEMIQKKALRSIHYRLTRSKMSYENLLKHYNIPKLSARRSVNDELLLYNICNNHYNCSELVSDIRYLVPRSATPRNICKLFYLPKTRTNAGRRAPTYRICNSHNQNFLSADIYNKKNVAFKRLINNMAHSLAR